WAHAEYAKLSRSIEEHRVLDEIPEVADRYRRRRPSPVALEVWSFRRQPTGIAPGRRLRLLAEAPFRLRWTDDDWTSVSETPSRSTALGIEYVDLVPPRDRGRRVNFTFYWTQTQNWEGRDFQITIG
ncbi:MAG TPA: glucan 1,4-alpha-glucosidase, partial [Thermoplasmata archaeon]|nr:glucan 1,4-alpha-glucosidase [Thermoplasmata archaeon]